MDTADITTRNSSPVNPTSSERISAITRSSEVTVFRTKLIARVFDNLSEIAEKLKLPKNLVIKWEVLFYLCLFCIIFCYKFIFVIENSGFYIYISNIL